MADWCYPDGSPPAGYTGPQGAWIPTSYAGENGGNPLPFYVSTDNGDGTGPITRLSVISSTITTKSGLHVGSAAKDVAAAFPDARTSTQSPHITLYSVSDASGQVVFDTGPEDGFATPTGLSVVHTIQVLPRGAEGITMQYSEYPYCPA